MQKEKQQENTKPASALEVLPVSAVKAIQPIDKVKSMMASGEYMKQVENYYRGNKEESMAFLTSAIEYIRKVPKLLQCDKTSLLMALMTSASFRLMPSGVMGEAYIIPYAAEAKFQLGYQGIVTLIWRTGKVRSIKAIIVYKNEHFRYEEGLQTILEHIPTKFGEKRGEPIGVYTVAETTNGGKLFQVMSVDQVMAIKNMSKAKDKPDSPWNSKDPEKWMWKKTCLIQLAKLLPKSKDLQKAIEEDYKGEGMKFEPSAEAVRFDGAIQGSKDLSMGNFVKKDENKKDQDGIQASKGDEESYLEGLEEIPDEN
jgi:phage RecT family recombinase